MAVEVLEYVLDDHNHGIVAEVSGDVACAIYREVTEDHLGEGPFVNKRAYKFTVYERGSFWSKPPLWIYKHDDHFYITTEEDDGWCG